MTRKIQREQDLCSHVIALLPIKKYRKHTVGSFHIRGQAMLDLRVMMVTFYSQRSERFFVNSVASSDLPDNKI
jgi:hypothetical protein